MKKRIPNLTVPQWKFLVELWEAFGINSFQPDSFSGHKKRWFEKFLYEDDFIKDDHGYYYLTDVAKSYAIKLMVGKQYGDRIEDYEAESYFDMMDSWDGGKDQTAHIGSVVFKCNCGKAKVSATINYIQEHEDWVIDDDIDPDYAKPSFALIAYCEICDSQMDVE